MLKDFKAFIQRGNVIDLAVAVIVGGAFGKIVASLVDDVIMPLLGKMMLGINFSELKWVLEAATEASDEVAVNYGMFIQNIVDFLIIAFVIFLAIRFMQKLKKQAEPEAEAPAAPAEDIVLLQEIRDLLKVKN
ncbi:MAG: large-conductance mechanosensitive channel protein MscL [Erysipelothrix sp.]|jgi:large conductance mechanosensitive channel|nr:large-conductance mechanosensitive channel protein MscL [Erysipelothrix sp.]